MFEHEAGLEGARIMIRELLADPQRYGGRAPIYSPPIRAYIRVGWRLCQGEAVYALTLADVDIDTASRRQGLFKALLALLHTEALAHGLGGVICENVMATELRPYLAGLGYAPISNDEHPLAPSLFVRF